MKKTTIFSMIALVVILINSCSSSVSEFTVKNNSTDFVGDLKGYLEIVNGNYTTTQPGGKNDDVVLTVKLKAIKQLESNKEFDEIRLELTDENGMPIAGMSTFTISKSGWVRTESENTKIDNALKNGEGEFGVSFVYDMYSTGGGSLNKEDALNTGFKKAKGFSIINSTLKEQSTNASVSTTSTISPENEDNEEVSTTNSTSNKDWDKVITDYEAYTDKYIKLLKKSKSGDMSAMTEYVEMLSKAQELQESLSEAESNMTPVQIQKFMKIQTKLLNAASGL